MNDIIYVVADSREQFDRYVNDRNIEYRYIYVRTERVAIRGLSNVRVVVICKHPHKDMLRELEYRRCDIYTYPISYDSYYNYEPRTVAPLVIKSDENLTLLLCD
jgi:hypothetical protein